MLHRLRWNSPALALLVLLAVATVGCNKPEAVSSNNSGYEAADDDSGKPAAADAGDQAGKTKPPAVDDQAGNLAKVDDNGTPNLPVEKPPIQKPPAIDPNKIPDGGPQEIANWLKRLAGHRPTVTSQEEMIAALQKMAELQLTAADKILASADATPESRLVAVEAKISALHSRVEEEGEAAMDRLYGYAEELTQDKDPEIALLGKLVLFSAQVDALVNGDEKDPQPTIDKLKTMLAEEPKDARMLRIGEMVVMAMQRSENYEEMLQVMQLVATSFQDNEDPQVAAQAAEFAQQAKNIAVELKLGALLEDKPEAKEQFLTSLAALMGEGPLEGQQIGLVLRFGQILEMSGKYDTAKEVFARVGKAMDNFGDPQIAAQVKEMVAAGEKRMDLLGKPFAVEGVNLDGTPFDWSKYKGKVVLLDFWASWCQPCIAELPNIVDNYEQYHAAGFEVVGINLDDEKQAVDEFLVDHKLPWATVLSSNPEQIGMKSPLATKAGVVAIPFILLIGPEGNVIDMHVRGERLGTKLAELFPAAAPVKPPVDPADPAKPVDPNAPADPAAAKPAAGAEANPPQANGDAPAAVPDPGTPAADQGASNRPPAADANAGDPPAKTGVSDTELAKINPYGARAGMTPMELVEFIFNMQEKPASIRARPGFSAAVVAACDRVLAAADATDKQQQVAILTRFEVLQHDAAFGDKGADDRLAEVLEELKGDERPQVAAEVKFLQLERRALEADQLELAEVPALLTDLKAYLAEQKLTSRHVRTASATVAAVNRLEDDDEREKHFAELGEIFSKSEDKQLAGYGKKLLKKPDAAAVP